MESLNTLHVVPDDKFSNMVHRDFERFGINNKYICFENPDNFNYIKGWKPDTIKKNDLNIYIKAHDISIVIFHSLLDKFILTKLPRDLVVVWCGWGYDYYSYFLSKYYPHGMILNHTKSVFNDSKKKKNITIMELLKGGYRVARRKFLNKIYPPRRITTYIDYFVPVISTEFSLIRDANPWFSCEFLSWSYGTLEEDYNTCSHEIFHSCNILVGNSATPENNHIEAFEFIQSNIDWQFRKIYCPLSYGDLAYAKKIKDIGVAFFGENFIPLMTFLDKKEYNEILSSCELLIFNHIRQQALGNIIAGLAMEKFILLNKKNPLCMWLDENNISYLTLDQNINVKTLSTIDKVSNKAEITKIWSISAIAEKTRKLVEITHNAAMRKK
ncbi:hypothetical protein C3432_02360 [Citrobacter amalonaticus]|uniref:4-alpha-L-fucosyltransferase n=1 Tax=Citrobacter amalonaticus TaxID=35703 RepID=A0A2S4S2S9_CITAM|nr:TDP-N-acetylfucosamine:lipid II N-acetylfucosaminyltransferase [Citrobacter amalonaticus]POT59586.1 hypothetical protein C3432_02360 [Citrobacter amalonaticus]POT77716.1 hypothetical protein C3436_10030 [Citrobacter amalonaticus]POU68168.1 hypothetical protein C3430_03565 [Citrobacter amalonaticus]POV07772.1 hypothetical protein C3424_03575 [Citrobacter amalonaticus]